MLSPSRGLFILRIGRRSAADARTSLLQTRTAAHRMSSSPSVVPMIRHSFCCSLSIFDLHHFGYGRASSSSFYHTTAVAHSPQRRRRQHRSSDGTVRSSPSSGSTSSSSDGTTPSEISRDGSQMDAMEFETAAGAFLDKIQTALLPLVPLNENMVVSRGDDNLLENESEEEGENEEDSEGVFRRDREETVMGEYLMIDLGPVHGQYQLQVDIGRRMIVCNSPISGLHLYILHEGEFCNREDGHRLDGILVRDLIRQIQGVPKL